MCGFILAHHGGFERGHTLSHLFCAGEVTVLKKQLASKLTDPNGCLDVQMTLPETEGEGEVKMLQ